MKITRISAVSGIEHTRDIAVTQEQLDRWNGGELIQRAMPNLSEDDREFIMTGITPEEWNATFSDHGDDPNDFDADEDHPAGQSDPDDEIAF